MSVIKRAGRNILLKAASEILSRFIYMFFFIYMARKLGASDFGLFSFAFSFAGIFAIIIDPGLNLLITRDVARDKILTDDYGDNIMGLKLILSVITLFLAWISLRLIGYDNNTISVVLLMGLFLMLNAFLDFFTALTDAHEKMGIGANIKIINKLLISILGAAVLYSGGSLLGLLNWMLAGSVISAIISLYMIRKYITTVKIRFQWSFIKTLLRKALPVAVTMVFTTVYFKIDIVMLSMYGVDNHRIGLYSAAVKLLEILNVIPAIFIGGIFPIMASFTENRKAELKTIFRKVFQVLVIIVIPVTVITTILSRDIITIIYGSEYSDSADALSILIWTSAFIFPNFILSSLIVIADRQSLNAVFSAFCLGLNVILNLLLIPLYGFIGAGMATVATDGLLFILATVFAVKYFGDSAFLSDTLKPLFCGLALSLIIISLDGLSIVSLAPLALSAYLILIFITKAISTEDIYQVRRAFNRS